MGIINQGKKLLSSKSAIAGVGMDAFFGVSDYIDSRNEGKGVAESAMSATASFLLPELVGTKNYLGYAIADATLQAGTYLYENANMQLRQMNRDNANQTPFKNYTFVDSPQIYTMRQAGLALAQQSKYNLQQTMIGNEAQFLHK